MNNTRPFRQSSVARAIVSCLVFSLGYTPILGSITNTVASAQAVQGTTSTFEYDANGNLKKVTDPLQNTTTRRYDALNRLDLETKPAPIPGALNPTIGFAYDGRDNVVSVVDPRNLRTSYGVDGMDAQRELASPDTGITIRTYDDAGNLKTSTDARGIVSTYSYDAANRIKTAVFGTVERIAFEYDGGNPGPPNSAGRLTKMTDGSGTTTYSYNAFGDVVTKVQTVQGLPGPAHTFTVSYEYGTGGRSNGKLLSMTYPSGARISYRYDEVGRVDRISLSPMVMADDSLALRGNAIAGSGDLLTNITYSPFGPVKSWNWGNHTADAGNTYSRSFDLDGRITSFSLGNVLTTGTVRTVEYDNANRIQRFVHAGGAAAAQVMDQTFGYDDLGQLISFTKVDTNQAFRYDASGNRIQATFGASTYTNTIDPLSNRLLSAPGPLPAKSYQYDLAGNVIADGSMNYSYNQRGRLASVSGVSGTTRYSYNGFGERVKKVSKKFDADANYYVYDQQGKLLGEYGNEGGAIQETVYLAEMPVAVIRTSVVNGPDIAGATASYTNSSAVAVATRELIDTLPPRAAPARTGTVRQIYYVYPDHQNTPRLITSTDSRVMWRWDNADSFGMLPPDENPTRSGTFTYNPRFPGQVFDKESNKHYNYLRDYDPQLGRYLQSDPIGLEGGINTYGYVSGNPVSFTDPTGKIIVVPIYWAVTALVAAGGALWWQQTHAPKADTSNDWSNPSPLMSEKEDRRDSHAAYKDYQRKGYDRDPNDPCQELKNRIAYLERLVNDRRVHDMRFPNPGWPSGARHADVNAADEANIKRLRERLKNECDDSCK